MPKRKRYSKSDVKHSYESNREQAVIQRLTHSKKLLYRALKTAKSFERQKLGKRLTRADSADLKNRLSQEIEILKGLDLAMIAESHLHKSLLKIKAFAESGLLPEDMQKVDKKVLGAGTQSSALNNNVVSGMLNMKIVKETMEQVIKGIYLAMGITVPARNFKAQKKTQSNGTTELYAADAVEEPELPVIEVLPANKDQNIMGSPNWDSFESADEILCKDAENPDNKIFKRNDSLDQEELARYDALIAVSSEESFDEREHILNRRLSASVRSSSSISSAVSELASSTHSQKFSSPEPSTGTTHHPQIKSNTGSQPPKAGYSTFLPTLMGGYWSGSEESASDLENFAPAPKKNRPGQMARRAIAEKKYGQNANHIKSGKGSVIRNKGRDDGWDVKRGAVEATLSGNRRSGFHGSHSGAAIKSKKVFPRENTSMSNEIKTRKVDRRDDVDVLHPSWQAAKKAKEAKQAATFRGKKVVFD